MDRGNGLDRFDLDDQFAFDEDIDTVADIEELLAVVDEGNGDLRFDGKSPFVQLYIRQAW